MSERWPNSLKVGDVIRRKGTRKLRVVRSITRRRWNSYFAVAVQRCGWTQRCYTYYLTHELMRLYEPTRATSPMSTMLDLKVNRAIKLSLGKEFLSCCQVEGMP